MSWLGMLGWAIVGASGVVDSVQKSNSSATSREMARADGRVVYNDAHGKDRLVSTNEEVILASRGGHDVVLEKGTGRVLYDLTSRFKIEKFDELYGSQNRLFVKVAKELGYKGCPYFIFKENPDYVYPSAYTWRLDVETGKYIWLHKPAIYSDDPDGYKYYMWSVPRNVFERKIIEDIGTFKGIQTSFRELLPEYGEKKILTEEEYHLYADEKGEVRHAVYEITRKR